MKVKAVHVFCSLSAILIVGSLYVNNNNNKVAAAVDLKLYADQDTILVRRVGNIHRERTPKEALVATGGQVFYWDYTLGTMSTDGPEEVELHYFRVNRYISSPKELAKEYERRGLTPDPIAQIADNTQHPEFAERYPNSMYWGIDLNNAGFCDFDVDRTAGMEEPYAQCEQKTYWGPKWWFGGVVEKK